MSPDDIFMGLLTVSWIVQNVRTHLYIKKSYPLTCVSIFGIHIKQNIKMGLLHESLHMVMLLPYVNFLGMTAGWIPIRLLTGLPPITSYVIAFASSQVYAAFCEMVADSICWTLGGKWYWLGIAKAFNRNLRLNIPNLLFNIVRYPHRTLFYLRLRRWEKRRNWKLAARRKKKEASGEYAYVPFDGQNYLVSPTPSLGEVDEELQKKIDEEISKVTAFMEPVLREDVQEELKMENEKCVGCKRELGEEEVRIAVHVGTPRKKLSIALCVDCIEEAAPEGVQGLIAKAKGFISMFFS